MLWISMGDPLKESGPGSIEIMFRKAKKLFAIEHCAIALTGNGNRWAPLGEMLSKLTQWGNSFFRNRVMSEQSASSLILGRIGALICRAAAIFLGGGGGRLFSAAGYF